MRYWLVVLAATLAACGGSSSSPPAQPVVEDTISPVITLTGDNPQFIEAGEAYTELGATATDNIDGDLTASIVIDASTVDTTVPGDYTVTYDVTDAAGNTATTVSRTVTVQDTTPPVITLLGDDPQVLVTGDPYTELRATAADSLDGDLTAAIVVDASAVDTGTAGDYAVTYDVSDAAGNAAATVTRTVRVQNPPLPAAPTASVEGDIKQLIFSWDAVAGAEYYRLLENADGHSGFTQVGDDIPAGTLTATRDIAVHLVNWVEAQYLVEACNLGGCNSSSVITAIDVMLDTIGYFKSSDPGGNDKFGYSVALSADGNTLVVGVPGEEDETFDWDQYPDCGPNCQDDAGAVFVFRRDDNGWYQEARIRETNQFIGNAFGADVELSADGNTMVVNAPWSWSGTSFMSPAIYIYQYDSSWQETALIRSPEPEDFDAFGSNWDLITGCSAIALSADGTVLAIGAGGKDALGEDSGKVYIFRYIDEQWTHTGSITASNGEAGDQFGADVAMNAAGTRLAIRAPLEDSGATGIDGNASDNSAKDSGALYVYDFDGNTWQETAYVKASNTGPGDYFGVPALSPDGDTLAVGAFYEDGLSRGVNGDDFAKGHIFFNSGAAYVFRFDGKAWSQQAYLKASNAEEGDGFGRSLALSHTGDVLAISTMNEDGSAVGIGGDESSNDSPRSGAVYVFRFIDGGWLQANYVKASNTDPGDEFGHCVAFSEDGNTMAVGAIYASYGTVYLY